MILDSLGIGSSFDAENFNDSGSDTFGHISRECFLGNANKGRTGLLNIPNLSKLGILEASKMSTGVYPLGFSKVDLIGSYGLASEISSGKDTTSGHWEIAGVPVLDNWFYFENKKNSFPDELIQEIIITSKIPGILGNCHSSGIEILNVFGEEHIKTGKPIFYTSADSVFQVACHEFKFGLSKLYKLCEIIRIILNKNGFKVARVIARPFFGESKLNFQRSGNRKDLSMEPFDDTVMIKLIKENQGAVVGIGKVSDIYAGVGITKKVKAVGLEELCNSTVMEIKKARNNTIIFTNFVDFDSNWGHRRDVSGYAQGLEFFDFRLSEIINLVKKTDLLIITSDHGCDPTWKGSDHTREYIPILIYYPGIKKKFLGHRETFSDIGQTIAKYFLLSDMKYGKNML